jgi:hypothetical protein
MALLNQSVLNSGQIASLFETLRAGQAPDKFTREFLKTSASSPPIIMRSSLC